MTTAVEWLQEKFNENNAKFINWSEDYFILIIPKEETKKYKVMIVGDSLPKQETLEHTSKFIVFTIPNCEEWVQHSIPLDSFEKANDFCQQFRDKKMSYLICKTLKQGYNGK